MAPRIAFLLALTQFFFLSIAVSIPAHPLPVINLNDPSNPFPTSLEAANTSNPFPISLGAASNDPSRYIPPSRLPPKEFTLYSSDPGKSILTDWYGWDGAKHFGWGAAFNVTTVQDAVKQATLYAEMHHNAKTPIPLPSLDEHKEHLFTWHSNVDGGGDYKLVVKYGMTWYELALISGIISNFCEKYTWEGKVPGFSFLAYDDDEAEAIARGLFYDVGMPPAPRAVQ